MITLPVDIGALADAARANFSAAMLDDPTLWPDGAAVMPSEVATAAFDVVRDSFRSTLARSVGAHIENIATDMDVAIAEDGPLADLAEVWGLYVTGLELEDYSPVTAAPDRDARVEALKTLVTEVLAGLAPPSPSAAQIDAYIRTDSRLADLATSQRLGAAAPAAEIDPQPAPEVLVAANGSTVTFYPDETEGDALEGSVLFGWDDEGEPQPAPKPAPEPAPEPTPVPPAGDVRPMPLLFHLLEPIGVLMADVADITGIHKPTLSVARSGKRPWQGLTEKQAHDLAAELDARAEAATALARRLRALEPAVVDGNRA